MTQVKNAPTSGRRDARFLAEFAPLIAALAGLDLVDAAGDDWPTVAAAGITASLDLSGSVDVEAERARLSRALADRTAEVARLSARIGNESFTAKAPEAVVAESRRRLVDAKTDAAMLRGRLDALAEIR